MSRHPLRGPSGAHQPPTFSISASGRTGRTPRGRGLRACLPLACLLLAVPPLPAPGAWAAPGAPGAPSAGQAATGGGPLPALALLPGWLRPHLPAWAERWLYNPRERTDAAMDALAHGDGRSASDLADTALRIAGDDPVAAYNAGTAHLDAGDARQAVPLLEKAAKAAGSASASRDRPAAGAAEGSGASSGLAPAVDYNLGNSRLAAGDAAGAVEAYKSALRARPDFADAKFNLELALQRREQDRLRTRAPREGSRGDRQGGKESAQGGGAERPADSRNDAHAPDPGRGRQGAGGQTGGQSPGRPAQPAQPAPGQLLPGFQNQPDMSAREALAVLEAVQNLERQQRREAAAKAERQRTLRGEDW